MSKIWRKIKLVVKTVVQKCSFLDRGQNHHFWTTGKGVVQDLEKIKLVVKIVIQKSSFLDRGQKPGRGLSKICRKIELVVQTVVQR